MKKTAKKWISIALAMGVCLMLIAFVFALTEHARRRLYSDIEINLAEIVTQNRDIITSRLSMEMNSLLLASKQVASSLLATGDSDEAHLKRAMVAYCAENGDARAFIASREGRAFIEGDRVVSIANRRYFQQAMVGIATISERLVSKATNEYSFVFSAPVYVNGEIAGTLQRVYTPSDMYAMCSVSLFADRGFVNIINSVGVIQVSSASEKGGREADNYYTLLALQGNQAASRELNQAAHARSSGFLEITLNGTNYFSAYTPIEAVHDWYLISSVERDIVASNANAVLRMFFALLGVVSLIFAVGLLGFLRYRRRQRAHMEDVAFLDAVTRGDTYNKFTLDLSSALLRHPEKQYFLLVFSIENYLYYNTLYGFDFTNRLLRDLYARVKERLLPGETLARVSLGRFVALLEDASKARMDALLALKFAQEGVTICLCAGLYPIKYPNEGVNLMVDKATCAAQSALGSPRRKIVAYSEQFALSMIRNEQFKRQIEHGLANREFIPFYQPKIDVNTGALVGAEALARWRTAGGRLIPPGEFIPVCERTGQVIALDMLIFEQALDFLARKRDQGVACLPISVNFSRLHLMDDAFIHQLIARLEAYRVPPELIEIELTESIFLDDHDVILNIANHLHEHGLMLSIDDFGSGYSSLNMLKDIPVDVLKIDRGFLDATENRERQHVILSSVVQMAKRMRIRVVVEGVQTQENVALMKQFGCEIAQGYYFAKPMSEAQFEPIFREKKL